MGAKPYIKVTEDGPYMAFGIRDIAEKIILADKSGVPVSCGDGKKFEIKKGKGDMPVMLCRCAGIPRTSLSATASTLLCAGR